MIVIVGAGLVGSLLAVLLRQKGFEVTLVEKRKDPRSSGEERGRSINLVVTSRGLHGLEMAGLKEEVMKITIPVFGRMMHSKSGETQFQPYGTEKECNYSVSRSELNNFLLNAAEKAGATLVFDSPLKKIDFEAKKVKAGREISYDVLFGADGAGSAVRREMLNHLNDKTLEKVEWLEADYKELVMPAKSPGVHRMEKNALHIWPRGSHMLMALANGDGSFTMTLYLKKEGPLSFEAIKTVADVKNLFASEFPDAVPLLPHYVEEFQSNPQGALGTVRCRRWVVEDSVALIGDAAHAIIPFFGQGMNCGFEDCSELMNLLSVHNGEWDRVLREYEQKRLPNTEAIADMALENWSEMKEKVGDQQFLLRKKVEGWLEKEFPGLYKSRYGMVTYTLIPYSLALEAGRVQDKILKVLCQNISRPEEISKDLARDLLNKEFLPFAKAHKISF